MRIRFALLIVCLSTVSCVTNTALDGLVYPSEYYSSRSLENPERFAMCTELEDIGYIFDEFSVRESGLEVTYPDGHQQQYPQSIWVNPVVVTSIDREYNNPEIFSDDELHRLEDDARMFCEDYQRIAAKNGISLPLDGVFYWDYIDGVRGGFYFNESCDITSSYGWSTGSYANSYQRDPDLDCPSGRVTH